MTTLGHFASSLVNALMKAQQTSREQRDYRGTVCDLRFLRRLITLWTVEWDSLSELDQLTERLQVCSASKHYDADIYLP